MSLVYNTKMQDFESKSDEELAEILKSDNHLEDKALSILMDRYQDKLDRYIKRISNFSQEEREDILQNVFISLYENINSFNPSLKFSSWIYRIAHNHSVSRWRKYKKENMDIALDDAESLLAKVLSDESDVIEEIEAKEKHDLIHIVLLKIPDNYREILILYFMENKSYEEISDILRIPKSTVGTQIRRAKLKMKKELGLLNLN